jgi:hypothetical protein
MELESKNSFIPVIVGLQALMILTVTFAGSLNFFVLSSDE